MPLPTIRETTMKFPASAANTLHKGTGVFSEFSALTAANIQAGGAASTTLAKTVLAAPAATINFLNLPTTYSSLRVDIQGRSAYAGPWASLIVQVGTGGTIDTAFNYDQLNSQALGTGLYATESLGINYFFLGPVIAATAVLAASSTFSFWLPNYSGSTLWKNVISLACSRSAAGTGFMYATRVTGVWKNTAPVTSIAVFTDSPGWASGAIVQVTGIP